MCGYNNFGQLGNGSQLNVAEPQRLEKFVNKSVVAVSCSYYHTLIIVKESKDELETSVYGVGRNDSGQLGVEDTIHKFEPEILPFLSRRRIIETACGLHHSIFVSEEGEVFYSGQLGLSNHGKKTIPTLIPMEEKVVQVSCGYYHTLLRTEEGKVYSFGRNDKG